MAEMDRNEGAAQMGLHPFDGSTLLALAAACRQRAAELLYHAKDYERRARELIRKPAP